MRLFHVQVNINLRVIKESENVLLYSLGSPPLAGSEKVIFRFWSVNNIVIPAANISNDNNNHIAIINTEHMNNCVWY